MRGEGSWASIELTAPSTPEVFRTRISRRFFPECSAQATLRPDFSQPFPSMFTRYVSKQGVTVHICTFSVFAAEA